MTLTTIEPLFAAYADRAMNKKANKWANDTTLTAIILRRAALASQKVHALRAPGWQLHLRVQQPAGVQRFNRVWMLQVAAADAASAAARAARAERKRQRREAALVLEKAQKAKEAAASRMYFDRENAAAAVRAVMSARAPRIDNNDVLPDIIARAFQHIAAAQCSAHYLLTKNEMAGAAIANSSFCARLRGGALTGSDDDTAPPDGIIAGSAGSPHQVASSPAEPSGPQLRPRDHPRASMVAERHESPQPPEQSHSNALDALVMYESSDDDIDAHQNQCAAPASVNLAVVSAPPPLPPLLPPSAPPIRWVSQ